jgi:hypothetical protein
VAVLVPGNPVWPQADGLFDLRWLGAPGSLQWPDELTTDRPVLVDDLTPEIAALLFERGAPSVLFLTGAGGYLRPGWRRLGLVDGGEPLSVHVPVNRLAERNRHHGFGFTDYLLVLSDRSDHCAEPPPAAAWLSAAFTEADVVVVEAAVASAWKGRALRGRVSVDTRMDLWRIMAHASICVDLAPGSVIARECIEALRFGTPIAVPEGSGPAEMHAEATGGMVFGDPDELLAGVSLLQQSDRARTALTARRYADDRYGNVVALVGQISDLLKAP